MTGRLRVLEAGAALVVGFLVLAPLVALVWPADADDAAGPDAASSCSASAEEPLAKKPKHADPDDDADDAADGHGGHGKGKAKDKPVRAIEGGLPPVAAASEAVPQC
ncbi:MAG: hypothetical protein QOD77_288 [Thermoplasmata archaeon]|jgi:hypothetical protein|nr:hypothetical protein [Thermoplasmata archaeon]